MWLCRALFAVSFLGLFPITVSAATETDWQDIPLDRVIPDATAAFPDLIRAWEQRFPQSGDNGPPDWIGILLQLTVIVLGSLCFALALPGYRRRGANQASRAASEISRIRWTMARNPFERWDDR